MAYTIGTANNVGDLVAAWDTALSTAGFSNTAGVWSKGTLNVRLSSSATMLHLDMSATTNVVPLMGGSMGGNSLMYGITYPCTYRIFSLTGSGAETYMLSVRFANLIEFQHIAFGFIQDKVGSYTGGEWCTATYANNTSFPALAVSSGAGVSQPSSESGGSTGESYCHHAGFFIEQTTQPNYGSDWISPHSWLRCDVEGAPGTVAVPDTNGSYTGSILMLRYAKLPLMRGLNTWNKQATLVPLHLWMYRPSGFCSRLGMLGHLRLLRADYYETGDIITIGGDKWMVLPVFKRGVWFGSQYQTFVGASGTLYLAIKYDGP